MARKKAAAPRLPLETVRIQNFKAVRDSGEISFTPLTVFIGNNGSGKSSLIEALETFQNLVIAGLDEAFVPWRGFEQIWNQAKSHEWAETQTGAREVQNPMGFDLAGAIGGVPYRGTIEIVADPEKNRIWLAKEDVTPAPPSDGRTPRNEDLRGHMLRWVERWQFLDLDPAHMLAPTPEIRSGRAIFLARDGANIAQYLKSIEDHDPSILAGIVDTLRSVLPYAEDLRPAMTTELQRTVYLRLTETGIKQPLPGWLLSQGTLRIVALLAVLRHPLPPSVVFIEEMENGLDPRTIHLLVEEIRSFLGAGGQVVATTHSPYLLDLLDLSHLIVVERGKSGAPTFVRPSKRKLKGWAEKFAPGRLYTMGSLTKS